MAVARQYCTFLLGGQVFGIEAQRVQEVIRHTQITPVPLASSALAGLTNLRGNVVTVINLRTLLNLPAPEANGEHRCVVVGTDESRVSLRVDEIGQVVEVSDDLFERPPLTLAPEVRELIPGAYKLEEYLLHVLDVDRVIEAPLAPGTGAAGSGRGGAA